MPPLSITTSSSTMMDPGRNAEKQGGINGVLPYSDQDQQSRNEKGDIQQRHSGGHQMQELGRVEPHQASPMSISNQKEGLPDQNPNMRPFPYFFYRDLSEVPDPDPLIPLTPPGRVPNFPAKMHSILSRADLSEIVAWMPHGRAWRVLKPREFEAKVIPTYFEHAKYSSFVRQANGWGFRRITQGRDRNSYYHEAFLRGLPHLCKMMKRPGVFAKPTSDPEHEPDFFKISEEKPLPEGPTDDSILLHCTLQGGPKARMPIYGGSMSSSNSSAAQASGTQNQPLHRAPIATTHSGVSHAPTPAVVSQGNMNMMYTNPGSYQQSSQNMMSTSSNAVYPVQSQTGNVHYQQPQQIPMYFPATTNQYFQPQAPPPNTQIMPSPVTWQNQMVSPNMMAMDGSQSITQHTMIDPISVMPPAVQADPTAAAQFAAGFAAARALSQNCYGQMYNQNQMMVMNKGSMGMYSTQHQETLKLPQGPPPQPQLQQQEFKQSSSTNFQHQDHQQQQQQHPSFLQPQTQMPNSSNQDNHHQQGGNSP